VLALGFLSAPARIFFAENLTQFWAGQNVSTRPRGVVAGISEFGFCEAWFAGRDRDGQHPPCAARAAVRG
jgi:hypothetical protein